MAKSKSSSTKTVRLQHINGGTVVVPEDREESLTAGGLFSKPSSSKSSS